MSAVIPLICARLATSFTRILLFDRFSLLSPLPRETYQEILPFVENIRFRVYDSGNRRKVKINKGDTDARFSEFFAISDKFIGGRCILLTNIPQLLTACRALLSAASSAPFSKTACDKCDIFENLHELTFPDLRFPICEKRATFHAYAVYLSM